MSDGKPHGAGDETLKVEAGRTVGDTVQQEELARRSLAEQSEQRVRELAQEEISAWQKSEAADRPKLLQPKTWSTRTLGGAVAVAIVVLLLGVYELANPDRAAVLDHLHDAIGTDGRVANELSRMSTIIRTASAEGSQNRNPLYDLVTRTMQAAPVLAFHGEATFGEPLTISITNQACRLFLSTPIYASSEGDLPPPTVEVTEGAGQFCNSEVKVDLTDALDIPFHARFFKLDNVGPPHQVRLALFIDRKNSDDDSQMLDQGINNRPAGLCILYNAGSTHVETQYKIENGLLITKMKSYGNGFWTANLTQTLKDAKILAGDPGAIDATEFLHSISVRPVKPNEYLPAGHPCEGIASVDNQTISVRAMVLVNKMADDRQPSTP